MAISIQEARGLFTKELSTVFNERPRPTGFIRSFFKTKENSSRYVSIEVQRGSETIAVDVLRGDKGNLNTFNRSTEKIYEPYYRNERFNATELDVYDAIHVNKSGTVDQAQFKNWMTTVTDKLMAITDKIVRAEEVSCTQVLIDGIVTSNATTNIDFKRKAGSKVDLGAGNYWINPAIDPLMDIKNGCEFIRKEGKTIGGIYTLILGTQAAIDLSNNAIFLAKADRKDISIIDIGMESFTPQGAVPFGRFMAHGYMIQAYTYPQFYDLSGVSTPYIDPKKAILLPQSTNFTMEYAAVPMLQDAGSSNRALINKVGSFHIYDYIDQDMTGHYYGVKSASLPIPVAIDTIYTLKAVA